MSKRILLTGGRAPATLELVRAFHRAGHTVFMAESLRGHLSEPSNAIAKNFLVPPPRQQTRDFLDELEKIVRENRIDLLIPTCEEVFYISMGRAQLPCDVFAESIDRLDTLHNKWKFILKAAEKNLPVPKTFLIKDKADLLNAYEYSPRLVFKPIYSRLGTRTLILPLHERALSALTFDSTWIAQEWIQGRQICTYSVCHEGRITAHAAHRSDFTAGPSGTILLRHQDHQAAFEWVCAFVAAIGFTGQIVFDFIETPDGLVYVIECNPHSNAVPAILFDSEPRFPSAFLDTSMDCLTPPPDSSIMFLAGMLIYGLPASLRNRQFGKWFAALLSSRDITFRLDDPLPGLMQFRSILHFFKIARRQKITMLDASMLDMEWNG